MNDDKLRISSMYVLPSWVVYSCCSAQTSGDVCETNPYDKEDISCLVTVTVEEDQIKTPTCLPGAFIRQ